jgi:hypothetical protein
MKANRLFLKVAALFLVAQGAFAQTPSTYREDRVFIINAPIKNSEEFKKFAKQASRLKPYGRVQLNISTLADKSFHEIPKQGSPWHEYASNNPTPFKFFPDAKLAPFIPAEFVKKNRQALVEKSKILHDLGLEAAFFGYEPNFLPEAFFDAYPQMLGPRVDHPRRSTEKAFAPCINVPETQAMYAGMMAEMLKNAPEISTFFFKTNDAGAGICWAHWLYTGPNGPTKCKNIPMGQKVNTLLKSFQDGAAKAGKKLNVYLDEASSNFSDEEKDDIQRNLPANCYYKSTDNYKMINVGSMVGSNYPVTGIIDAASFIQSASSVNDPAVKAIFVNFRVSYDRGYERLDAADAVFDMLEMMLKNTQPQNAFSKDEKLKELCEQWAGKDAAENLYNAFTALNNAYAYKSSVFPRVSSLYWGVTTRHITRPLVIIPAKLTEQEESYFLPFVFNVSKDAARNDYTDVHGSRNQIPAGAVQNFVRQMNAAAALFEKIPSSAPKKDLFSKMAISIKIHASFIRSSGNFATAQLIRDRNKEKLTGESHFPSKEPTFTGDPDFIPFVDVARDELDNTQELIDLLEKGGNDLVIYSKDPLYEDKFVLGPNLVGQLKKKRKVMLDHWSDIEGYMASPFK